MDQKNVPITGSCLCGAVSFEINSPATGTGICHCGMCQKALGNLFGAWTSFRTDDINYIGSEPTWYASSDIANRGFCRRCGSPIAYLPHDSEVAYVWTGALDEPSNFKPERHYHVESRISWADILDELPVGPTTYEIK